jgi:cystathionine beta-lyase/cystathionine gamma-synthase
MKGGCGLLTVILKATTIQQIVTFCESLRHILMAVSWGGHESLAIPKCASIEPSAFDPNNPEHRMIRFYIGLEEPDYLISDIDQALSGV